jgi:hypothetical protein
MIGFLAFCLLLSGGDRAQALTIFSETFDGYTEFPDQVPANDEVNLGRPLQSEGASELWFAARFGQPETECGGIALECDLAVQAHGGSGNNTPVGRFEDQAGLLFAVDTTGLSNVLLSFDWRTFAAPDGDQSVAGYFVGTSPFGDSDSVVDPAAFTELLRVDVHSDFTHNVFQLPSDAGLIWVAFWHDGGENDYTKLDNVLVTADPVPEPSALLLLLLGSVALGAFGSKPR